MIRSIVKLTLLLVLPLLLLPAVAFAQDDSGGIVIDWMGVIAPLITAVAIPVIVQILTQVWPRVPDWMKTLAPIVLVPLITLGGTALSGWLGVPVDLTAIVDIITGASMGLAATVAYKFGSRKPQLLTRK
jgi:fructose-specific phosphotransferase system IIC component